MTSPGTVLGDRYRLESRIAIGGMGEVWRAEDMTLSRTVAVKVLKPEYAEDPSFLERFRAEARNTARLAHAGIATVYDYGEVPVEGAQGDSAFLVMELVPGRPLSAILSERGRLTSSETMSIVGQTALALQAAHERGVIHRDVKPGNLIITPEGRVKVTDFGIARATDDVPLTQTGTVLGTSFYLSPEQASGEQVGPASDVYSLGVVAYECLAGRRPFQGTNPVAVAVAHQTEPPPQLPPDVPPAVAALVYSALAKSPRDRPPTAGEFGRQALALTDPAKAAVAPRTQATEVIAPAYIPPRTQPQPPARRKVPVAVWLIGLLVLLAVLVTVLVLRSQDSGGDPTPSPTPSPTVTSESPTPSPTTSSPSPSPSPTTQAPTTPPPTTPVTIPVNANTYIGQPVSAARSSLQLLGLNVNVPGAPGPGATVTNVTPTGNLAPLTEVTLSWTEPTTPPPTTTPPPPPTSSPAGSASPSVSASASP